MDAPCKIQGSIHVFRLVYKSMCPGFWVHITFGAAGVLRLNENEIFYIIQVFVGETMKKSL